MSQDLHPISRNTHRWLLGLPIAAGAVLVLLLASQSRFARPPGAVEVSAPKAPGQLTTLLGSDRAKTDPEPDAATGGRVRFLPVEPVPPPPQELHGQVVDAVSGRPVQHFKLFHLPEGQGDILQHATGKPSQGIVRHDLEGRFRLAGLSPGRYSLLVDPTQSGYEPAVLSGVSFPRQEAVTVEAGRGTHVTGRVLDALGQPVSFMEVRLDPDPVQTDGPNGVSQETDAEGQFLFTLVPPGAYTLAVSDDQGTTEYLSVSGGKGVGRDLSLWSARTLTVTVTDPGGQPLEGAEIRLWSRVGSYRRAVTELEGRADVRGMALGTYAAQVRLDGFRNASRTVDMVGGDEYLRIRLDRQPGSRR